VGKSTWIRFVGSEANDEQQAMYDKRVKCDQDLGVIFCSSESFQLSKHFKKIDSCFTHALSTILKEKEGIVENKELADAINEFFGKLRFLPKEGGTRKLPSEVQNATLYCGDKQATCLFFEAP
jgi:hypothetical protein